MEINKRVTKISQIKLVDFVHFCYKKNGTFKKKIGHSAPSASSAL